MWSTTLNRIYDNWRQIKINFSLISFDSFWINEKYYELLIIDASLKWWEHFANWKTTLNTLIDWRKNAIEKILNPFSVLAFLTDDNDKCKLFCAHKLSFSHTNESVENIEKKRIDTSIITGRMQSISIKFLANEMKLCFLRYKSNLTGKISSDTIDAYFSGGWDHYCMWQTLCSTYKLRINMETGEWRRKQYRRKKQKGPEYSLFCESVRFRKGVEKKFEWKFC